MPNNSTARMPSSTTSRTSPNRLPMESWKHPGIEEIGFLMPGCFQLSIGNLLGEVREVVELGIPAVLLFGIPSHKDPAATGAYDPEGVVQMAVRAIKDEFPDLVVITAVCLCANMDHGHCGVVQDGEIVNDVTLELLCKMAITHAESGADFVA